jgi:glutathione reductase (NADPH)
MWNAAEVVQIVRGGYAKDYGLELSSAQQTPFDWSVLKSGRDKYIKDINEGYREYLTSIGIQFIKGHGSLGSRQQHAREIENHSERLHAVVVTNSQGTAKTVWGRHVVIATGGRPEPLSIPGGDLALNSDQFFALNSIPKRCAVIGAGYIAVELAGVLNSLGAEVHWFIRFDRALRSFDHSVSECVMKAMEHAGIRLYRNSKAVAIEREDSEGRISFQYSDREGDAIPTKILSQLDAVISAIGRSPNSDQLGLAEAGVRVDPKTHLIVTDRLQNTSVPHIYAIGDVCGPLYLTPGTINFL